MVLFVDHVTRIGSNYSTTHNRPCIPGRMDVFCSIIGMPVCSKQESVHLERQKYYFMV